MAEIALIGHNRCESTKSADYLFDISLVRIFAIILLVVSHSLCVHTGAWDAPDGLILSRPLKWIAKSISGFGIQIMPLIAGYIFAFQFVEEGRNVSFKDYVLKKSIRLLIPCYILSALYYILFGDDNGSDVTSVISKITNGVGHLWFLPSLFWSYIILRLINSYKFNHLVGLSLVFIFYLFGISISWFGISSVNYVLFFMYCGYLFKLYGRNVPESIPLALALFIFSVVILYGKDHFIHRNVIYLKQVDSILIIIVSLCRFYGLYVIARFILRHITWICNSIIKQVTKFCYGIYLFHQFILCYLYFHTSICLSISSIIIAVIAPLITLLISILITGILHKSYLGKVTIG
ncbi:MAG: acyltransferase [Muribaculum sp.]|nr:acyltransferase [Muribaculum sp.]